jgi:hypothetical protein
MSVPDQPTPPPSWWPGDVVELANPDPKFLPGPYRVTARPGGNRRSWVVEHIETGARVTAQSAAAFVGFTGEIPDPPAPLHAGALVRVTRSDRHIQAGALYVVIGTSADGSYKITRLGGDGGRYIRGVPAQQVEVIDPAAVVAALS